MNDLNDDDNARRLKIAAIFCAVLFLLLASASSFAASPPSSAASLETLSLGGRIYREGVLPSGKPLDASLKGGLSAPGTTFACVSCHLRSGLGSVDGTLLIPPISGAKLFKPFQPYSTPRYGDRPFVPRPIVTENLKYYPKPPRRPPYTDASLAEAIRHGVDPTGRILNDAMPRYLLGDEEMKLLISYLKSLSSEYSPGVSETTIRFATIITDNVSPVNRNAMLVPLENYINARNETNFSDQEPGVMGSRSRLISELTFIPKGVAVRRLALSRWVLKGPPETWRGQLEEYNRKEPVFAILGGITTGEWQPIHQFCEEHRIPSLFPITDFPVISQTDWYTLYLSKGYYREGEAAARFLSDTNELEGKPVVQIVRDTREGRALARGFQETWHDIGQAAPVTVVLKEGEPLTAGRLGEELAKEKPSDIVLWDGPEALKILETLAGEKSRPARVLVSSSYLGRSMFSLNEQAREFTYITYPYAMPPPPQAKGTPWSGTNNFNAEANTVTTVRIAQQSYILNLILNMALLNMRGDYFRDNLLDVIGTIMDQDVPLYGRLNFGAGQRYASKGCYIVQLAKNGRMNKTGWVTP